MTPERALGRCSTRRRVTRNERCFSPTILYERTAPRSAARIEQWVAALDDARREAQGEIDVLWQASTELERRVLKVVAHRTVPLTSREAAERFGLGKSGSTQLAVERLVGDGTWWPMSRTAPAGA